MHSPIVDFVRRRTSSSISLGKSMLSGGADLTQLAARQIGNILSDSDAARYGAFISYSHRDSDTARWLHRAIETYRVPHDLVGLIGDHGPIPRRLNQLFRDEDELAGASELGPVLEGALARSSALIVICSPAAAQSQWVDREIRRFKTVNPGRPVLAVIADGEPGGARECFPESLRFAIRPDGTLDRAAPVEPLAPDLKKQDRQVVKLKLLAGLLGVKYNDLYRRDRRRARRRAAVLGTLGFVIIAALSALSVAAVSYAKMAVEQRNLAQAAQRLAEQSAEKAERRAWLAQVAAQEIRRQAVMLEDKPGTCPAPARP